ncbi:MAG: type II toxin-antitoxin system YafQ family toxin [Bifidobacterium crudilactis]
MNNLSSLLKIRQEDVIAVREAIIDCIEALSIGEALPEYCNDHRLTGEPWAGYREFHVLDDVLVVYYRIEAKNRLRFVTVTTHEELAKGKLPQ